MKKRLLQLVLENFDASNEDFDPSYFRLLAEKTINAIELPVIQIHTDEFVQGIASKFSGEITNSAEKSDLKGLLGHTVSRLLENLTEQFLGKVKNFKGDLEPIKLGFASVLLKNIQDEFDLVLQQFENKENEIEKGKGCVEEIRKIRSELSLY